MTSEPKYHQRMSVVSMAMKETRYSLFFDREIFSLLV